MDQMRAVILAGGKGSRLAPLTGVFPKPLMPVGGAPILETIIRQLKHHGFTEIVLNVGHKHELIELYFGDGRQWGVHLAYCYEEAPLGTAGPLSLLSPFKDPVLVMNADVLSTINYADLYRQHLRKRPALTIGLYQKEVKIDLGVLETNEGNEVTDYVEKPTFSYGVSMGVYVIDPATHRRILRRGEPRLDLPELVTDLLQGGERVDAYKFEGYWLDIGRPADYETACVEFERLRDHFLAPFIEPETTKVAPAAARRRASFRQVLSQESAAV